jgi:EAL domain-containing protein (putative c-di-GMP-specific phosphodiesterase class I)
LAEQSGFIIDIGEWILSKACSLLTQWEKRVAMREATLAINVSAVELRNASFVSNLVKAVSVHNLKPGRLKLELTESVMALDLSELSAQLGHIKKLGILLALDDFGTGYSSMSHLRTLPIDQLKIDKSFLDQIAECQRDIIIVRGIVDLGKELGFSVIAEGVETQQQLDVLLRCGCLQYQGYLTGRPMTEAELYSKFDGSARDLCVQ